MAPQQVDTLMTPILRGLNQANQITSFVIPRRSPTGHLMADHRAARYHARLPSVATASIARKSFSWLLTAGRMSSKSLPFRGYAIHDTKKWSDFTVIDIQPKQWEEEDIDIAITHCGVCGTDLHILTNGWQNVKQLPLVAGHEIVGYAIRVGSIAAEKAGIKVGDRVGVGAQIGSCGDCRVCGLLRGNYCTKKIETYNDYYPDGTLSQGGYGTAIRANHRFVVPIPEGIKSEHAASMMCAGLTMYSPLTRQNVGPGSRVGIVGLGGLGHYGVLFAKALGAEVYAFSPDASKEEDMKKLGADHYVIATEENMAPLARTFDVILSTVDVVEGFSLGSYLRLLFVEGIFVNIGLPDHMLPQISPFDLVLNGCRLGGSLTGSKTQAIEMFKLAKAKNVQPWVEVMPMSKLKEAVEGAKAAKARYRYVLEQDLVPYSPA